MPAVRTGPLIGLTGQLVLLAVLARTVGLGVAGWLAGAAYGLVTCAALTRALNRSGRAALGPADRVTLARATLVGGVAALTVDSFARPAPVAVLVVLATVALVLDAVDGQVARRTGTASALGARFDMEVDAFLLLVLSVYVARPLGGWVLAIGAMRYAYVAAGWVHALAARVAAAALLAQGRRGDTGRRPRGRGGRGAAPAAVVRRAGGGAGPADRVVRPRRRVVVASPPRRVRRCGGQPSRRARGRSATVRAAAATARRRHDPVALAAPATAAATLVRACACRLGGGR